MSLRTLLERKVRHIRYEINKIFRSWFGVPTVDDLIMRNREIKDLY